MACLQYHHATLPPRRVCTVGTVSVCCVLSVMGWALIYCPRWHAELAKDALACTTHVPWHYLCAVGNCACSFVGT